MPSESRAQHNFMEGIAHGWHPTGMKGGPSPDVAKDFVAADKGRDLKELPQHVGKRLAAQKRAFGGK